MIGPTNAEMGGQCVRHPYFDSHRIQRPINIAVSYKGCQSNLQNQSGKGRLPHSIHHRYASIVHALW